MQGRKPGTSRVCLLETQRILTVQLGNIFPEVQLVELNRKLGCIAWGYHKKEKCSDISFT